MDLFDLLEKFFDTFFKPHPLPSQGPTSLPPSVTPVEPPPPALTDEQLAKIMPRLDASKRALYLPSLLSAMKEHQIDKNKLRVAMFLAQLALESGELRWWEEFADGKAYEGRKDLGNFQVGDGPKFKGRGPIQLTGRKNYSAAGIALGLDLVNDPKSAATPEVGFRVAGWYWTTHDLNTLSDKGDIVGVTKAINGGTNGLPQRRMYYSRALDVLGAN